MAGESQQKWHSAGSCKVATHKLCMQSESGRLKEAFVKHVIIYESDDIKMTSCHWLTARRKRFFALRLSIWKQDVDIKHRQRHSAIRDFLLFAIFSRCSRPDLNWIDCRSQKMASTYPFPIPITMLVPPSIVSQLDFSSVPPSEALEASRFDDVSGSFPT